MFSEYASKYLSKSQRPAPLFNGNNAGESDVDDYLEALSGSSDDDSLNSESESESIDSESDLNESRNQSTTSNSVVPPSELLVERPSQQSQTNRRKTKQKHKYALWKQKFDSLNGQSSARRKATPREDVSQTQPIASSSQSPNRIFSEPQVTYDAESGLSRSKPVDNLIAAVYLVSLAFTLATAALVSISTPNNGGGQVYPIFVYSAKSLVFYAVLATIVSALWLCCLRYFTKAVVQTSVFGVPVVLGCTSVISVILSVHSTPNGWHGLAHAAMRLSALVPLGVALLWVLYLRRVKDVTGKAADIVVLSAEVYNECTPSMTILTFISGLASLVITGLWSLFLARAFMEGKLGFLLVLWFSFMYLWTWELACCLLRAILASVTTEWYNGTSSINELQAANNTTNNNNMDGVLSMSIYEAVTFHFSSVCLSALASLLTRLPLLVLPSRLGSAIQRVTEATIMISASRILNPLVLPIAVIQRCSLGRAAQLLSSAKFSDIDKRAYKLAKLFLVAGRLCCSLSVGFIAWIHADRVEDRSSVYGYLVAIVAWFIGWTVMGSSESLISMICDALLVNYVLNPESARHENMQRLFSSLIESDEGTESTEYSD